MFIAKVIKAGSSLYRRIGERIRFLDTFFLTHPSLFFPVWIMTMAGLSAATVISNPGLYWSWEFHWETIFLFVGVTLVSGSAFIQYQIQNEEANELNHKIIVLKKANINSDRLHNLMKVSTMTGLLLILATLLYLTILNGNWIHLLGIIWGLLIYLSWGILYFRQRFQWSEKPLLGIVAHGLAGFSLFMLGWNSASNNLAAGILHSLPYVLLLMGVSMIFTIPDIEGDRQVGKNTFVNRFGIQSTVVWGTVFVSAAVITGYFLKDPVISTASIISLPFFIVALVFSRIDHVLRAIKYPVLILAMFICVRYPWFFVFLFLTFYFFKYYYYFRFNVDYPTFHVSHD